jgi:hypothetical protein
MDIVKIQQATQWLIDNNEPTDEASVAQFDLLQNFSQVELLMVTAGLLGHIATQKAKLDAADG